LAELTASDLEAVSRALEVLYCHANLRDFPHTALAAWIDNERESCESHHCRTKTITLGAATLDVRLIRNAARGGWQLLLEDHESRSTDQQVSALPPRMREVLELILDGLSEKEIATNLGLKFNTVHGYIKELHHRFGVSSRAELMARWIDR
jgi:DNA-binding CsgD family transcriptional regulator